MTAAAIAPVRAGLRKWTPFAVAALVFGAGMGAAWWGLAPTAAERDLCGRAVAALMQSHDLVEVERAGIIIRQLRCSLTRP